MKFWLSIILVAFLTMAASASTDIVGRIGKNTGGFTGRFPLSGGFGSGVAPVSGALLLEDGSSILLLEDGSSHLCLEGGC